MAEKNNKENKKDEEFENIPQDFVTEDYGEILAAWSFPEFEKPKRSRKWYIWGVIILAILIILSLSQFTVNLGSIGGIPFNMSFDKNPIFIGILVLFVFIYFYNERQGPLKINFFITEDGIVINERFIEYGELRNFWIIYYPPEVKNLYFQPRSNIKQRIIIPLQDQNPVEIRRILLEFLEEDLAKEEVPASEGISRILKL
jgi:hypothetical protein